MTTFTMAPNPFFANAFRFWRHAAILISTLTFVEFSPAWRKAFAKSLRWIVVFLIDVAEKPKILTSFRRRRSRVFGNQQLYGRGTCYHLHKPSGWKQNYKIWCGGKTTRYKLYPNQLNGLKSKKPHCIKRSLCFLTHSKRRGASHLIFHQGFPVILCPL